MIQLWAPSLFAAPSSCSDASPFFQDIGVDDITTGLESTTSLVPYACLDSASVAITGILDLGGAKAVSPSDTWRYSGRTLITNGGMIACIAPTEDPQYYAPVITYFLEGSINGNAWSAVDTYIASATGTVQRSGTFAAYSGPSIRYLRLTIYMSYYKIVLMSDMRARISDMRIGITAYVPPTQPPPRQARCVSAKGAEVERCVRQE